MAYARDIDALELFEDFLVASVASILVIRLVLYLAGYPTVGGDALHIAHMLWGGLFMLIALLLLLGYLGRGTKHLAAVLGGIGFGTFIDELGKFLTHDNDYFFEPTFALIYVIFVLMYVGVHALHRPEPEGWERLANAWDLAREGASGALDPGHRARIEALLREVPEDAPARAALEALLARLDALPPAKPRLMARLRAGARSGYRRLVRRPWFVPLVVVFFVAHSVTGLLRSLFLVLELWIPASLLAGGVVALAGAIRLHHLERSREEILALGVGGLLLAGAGWGVLARVDAPDVGFLEWGELVSTAVPAGLVLLGITRIRASRPAAFRTFYHAVLILVFVAHFFAFYHNQLVAVFGFFWNLLVLVTLRYAIAQEERIAAPRAEPARSG
jgi:hypothetical protein